jgi:hypothetical protein
MLPFNKPYNSKLHTDTNSLAQAFQTRPEKIGPAITYLSGREADRFPLSFLSEGLNQTTSISQDEYEYDVDSPVDDTRNLANDVTVTDPGLGGTPFELEFADSWFPPDYVLFSQSGQQVKILDGPYPRGSNYAYTVQMLDPSGNVAMPADDVKAGAKFTKAYAPVEQDYSRGNASTWTSPFKIRHKLSTLRKSYNFSGNASSLVTVFPMADQNGNRFDKWIDYEEYKHMMDWKEECETFFWYGTQNYTNDGRPSLYGKNGYPVWVAPGILDQIINRDTYSRLTEGKLRNIIGQLYYSMYDANNMNITLYTGSGGLEEFDNAMKDYMRNNAFTQFNEGRFVSGTGYDVKLGGYFRRYEHVHGHTINVVYNRMFDHGPMARAKRKHPRTGYSIESHRMVFVDQSTYDGASNLMLVNKKGREMKRWAQAGSTEPKGFETGPSRASDIDGASVHFLKQAGIVLRRFDTSLDLQCVAQDA